MSSAGARLDRFLAEALPSRSRSLIQRHLTLGAVLVDGQPPRRGAKTPLMGGERIDYQPPPPPPCDLIAQDLPLSILYEDEYLLIVDKPKNLVVHPAAGHAAGTLANAVLFHLSQTHSKTPQVSTSLRTGIVHRLDRDTTGAILVAKSEAMQDALGKLFQDRQVDKQYLAITAGKPKVQAGTLDTFYGRHPRDRKKFSSKVSSGKKAITHFSIREDFGTAARLQVQLETGRTHQIRVHLADLGFPLIGDPVYGGRRDPVAFDRPALHAQYLAFNHPMGKQRVEVTAPIPLDLLDLMQSLRAAR